MSSNQDGVELSDRKRLLDYLTTVGERIEETNELLEELRTIESEQAQTLADFVAATTDLNRGEVAPEPREYPWNFEVEVPADTSILDPVSVDFEPDYDAIITGIEIGYPDGIQQSVGIQIGTAGGEVWVPRGGTRKLAGEDPEESEFVQQDLSIEPNIKIDADNPIVAEFVNTDPSENHLVEIDLTLRERVAGDA
jgi:hypothetical protein